MGTPLGPKYIPYTYMDPLGRAPSYLNSRLLGYVTIGYVEPGTHYVGNWSPRVRFKLREPHAVS